MTNHTAKTNSSSVERLDMVLHRLRAFAVLVFLFLLVGCTHHQSHAAVFKISVNLPFQTASLGKAVENLMKFIRANEVTLQGIDPNSQHTFQVVYTATNYTQVNATMAMLDAIQNDHAIAAVGDWSSGTTIPQALAGAKYFMYMCSGAATSGQLSDKKTFPYFFRTIAEDPAQGVVIAHFIKHMGWESANIIASSDSYGQSVTAHFLASAREIGIKVMANQVFQVGQDYSFVLDSVFKSGSQIIVLMCISDNAVGLLQQARARSMIGNDWVWLSPESFDYWNTLQITPQDISNVNGLLYVYPKERTYNALYNASVARFHAAYPTESVIPSYSFLFLDCLTAIAKGIVRLAQDVSPADILARNYYPNMTKYFLTPFDGVTGDNIQYDANGNRLSQFQVFNWYDGVSTPVFDVLPDKSVVAKAPVKFFSGTAVVPSDRPKQVPLVPYWDSPAGIGLLSVNVIVLVAIVITWALLYTKRDDPSVRGLSFPFLTLICLGCMFVLLSNIAALGTPTPSACQVSLWLFIYGFELVMASSAAKAYRLWRIFDNKFISAGKVGNKYLFAGVAGIMLVQTIVLIAWTGVGAQQAVLVSNRTYYLYRCSSSDASTNTAFSGITLAYNALLLCALLMLAYKTRNIAANFKESQWLFYTGQNTLLSGAVVAAFAFFDFGESHLSAFIVKQLTIIYSVGFAFAALVARIAVAVGFSSSGTGVGVSSAGRHLSQSTVGPSSPSKVPASQASNQDPKNSMIRETLPVKKLGSLMSTWVKHVVSLHPAYGYMSLVPAHDETELGIVIRLQGLQYGPSANFENCLEVSAKGKAWVIQFSTAEERDRWIGLLSTTASTKKAPTTSSNGGGTGVKKSAPMHVA